MSKATQSNTQAGDIVLTAGVDLSDKEGRAVKVADDSGKPVVILPEAQTDITPYVLTEGAEADNPVSIRPLDGSRNVRLVLTGTCDAGDTLVLADHSSVPGCVKLPVHF